MAIAVASIATLAPRVMAQSTPPPGVTISPTAPGTIEQTIPKPSESPRLLPTEPSPSLPEPNLQFPPAPQEPEFTSP